MRKSFLFALLLCLLISICTFAASGTLPGTGTEADPYLIEDLADFDTFADSANAATYWAAGVHTKLMTNIDLSGRTYYRAIIAPDTNDSIYHFQGIPYVGNFDGNNHKIENFRITGKDLLGLFGHLGDISWDGNPGSISNLNVIDIQIIGSGNWIGGLVGGHRNGTITNCCTSGSVVGTGHDVGIGQKIGGLVGNISKGEISNCYSSAQVEGHVYVGGLIGDSGTDNIIQYSYFSGDVNGDTWVGGLIGNNASNLTACFNEGTVSGSSYVGGLVGDNDQGSHIIKYCYNNGGVSGGSSVGGLVGYNSFTEILNCYSTGEVIPILGNIVGGLVGVNRGRIISSLWNIETSGTNDGVASEDPDPAGVIGKTTSEMKILTTYTDEGWDFIDETVNGAHQLWQMPIGGGYPVLSRFNGYVPVTLNGDGTSVSPYLISNVLEMGAIYDYSPNAFYQLTTNIDMSGIKWSTAAIPVLNGGFDGDGHIISNLNIEGGSKLGLFGDIGSDGAVVDLNLENTRIVGIGNYIGALVADNSGNILNCSSRNSSVDGNGYYIGGLTGKNNGGLEYCYTSGLISGNRYSIGGLVGVNIGNLMYCYSITFVGGDGPEIGGLVGANGGSVAYCYSAGNVTAETNAGGLVGVNGGSVIYCYSSSKVNGIEIVGGLVGENWDTLSNCFWDINTSGTADGIGNEEPDPNGVKGKTTAEMMTQSTFTGWDFTTPVWMMLREGEDYPRLAWQEEFDGDIAGLYGVDMVDFAYLASYWGLTGCSSGTDCGRADIDNSGDVGLGDLVYIAQDWLSK